jgi:hypothetical protein
MGKKKLPKLSTMPKAMPLDQRKGLRQELWTRLTEFLEQRGYTPNSGDACPVNYADTVDFALEILELTGLKGPLKDPALNVLQEVRRLKHTCPGCGQNVESHQLYEIGNLKTVEVARGVKKGSFFWHEPCLAKLNSGPSTSVKELNECIEESETDLSNLILAVLAAKVDTTSGYRLKLAASELRDKYADSPRFLENK